MESRVRDNGMSERSPALASLRQGFTLIEILIVIVIIAVMSAVVVPAFANLWERSRFDSECANARALFAWARQQAVERDTTVSIHFDAASQTFTASLTPTPSPTDQPSVLANQTLEDNGLAVTRSFQLNSDFKILGVHVESGLSGNAGESSVGAPTDILFRGDGTVNSAEFVILSRFGERHFSLSPATGVLTTMPESGAGGS